MLQDWPLGCVSICMAYRAPAGCNMLNRNAPFALTASGSIPLLVSTRPVPVRPVTTPPTAYLPATDIRTPNDELPSELPAVTEYVVVALGSVGVPEMLPSAFSLSP